MQLGPSKASKGVPVAAAAARPATPTAAQRAQAQRRTARTRPASRGIQIGDENPAIPLDKVPFFTSDLIRLAITAVVMIALLVVGAKLVIPHFTG